MKKPRSHILKQRRATVYLEASDVAEALAGRPGLSFQSKPRIPVDAVIVGGEFNPFRSAFRFIYQTETGFGFQLIEGEEPPDREFPLDVADMDNPENLRALVADYLEDHPEQVAPLGRMALVIVEEVETAVFERQVKAQENARAE
jgi:hypothetical protein